MAVSAGGRTLSLVKGSAPSPQFSNLRIAATPVPCVGAWANARASLAAIFDRASEELPEADYALQAGHVEVQHAEALRSLGDLTAARQHAQQAVAVAKESHVRGQTHRFATLAMILAGERKADAAADVAIKMLDLAAGMESGRVQDRIVAVRDAVSAHADGTVARDLSERVRDVIGRELGHLR